MATTKDAVKKPAVKKVAKPKKATVADKAPASPKAVTPKPTPKPAPKTVSKPKDTQKAIEKLIEAEAKIWSAIKAVEADCKKGAGLTGLQRREHKKELQAIAAKLGSLLA